MANTKTSTKTQAPSSTQSKKSWRDVLSIHPAAELFPLMSPDDLRALGEDIKKNGLRNPVAIWTDPHDGKPYLLDGRNRADGMEIVGLDVIDGKDGYFAHETVEGDPYAYAISANIHRRHLTPELKRKLISELLKATPDKSDRQIAETVKASPSTVGKVRQQLEDTGEVSKLDTRTDKKGVKQPAAKPKPAAKSAKDPAITAAVDRAVARSEENRRRQTSAGNDSDPAETADRRKAEAQTDLEDFTSKGLMNGSVSKPPPPPVRHTPQTTSGYRLYESLRSLDSEWGKCDRNGVISTMTPYMRADVNALAVILMRWLKLLAADTAEPVAAEPPRAAP